MNTVLTTTFVQFHQQLGTSRQQLEEMRDRIFDRRAMYKQEILDLHEMLASGTCAANGLTPDEAMSVASMLDNWCEMDEDRLDAITDLLTAR